MANVRNVPPAVGRAAPGSEFAEVSGGFQFSKTGGELNMRFPKWVALFKKYQKVDRSVGSADASRDGTAKPAAATESEPVADGSMTATSIPSRHDDGSSPFPQDLRHRRRSDDGAPLPSWWRNFFR